MFDKYNSDIIEEEMVIFFLILCGANLFWQIFKEN